MPLLAFSSAADLVSPITPCLLRWAEFTIQIAYVL
jgi:hypothetical protein